MGRAAGLEKEVSAMLDDSGIGAADAAHGGLAARLSRTLAAAERSGRHFVDAWDDAAGHDSAGGIARSPSWMICAEPRGVQVDSKVLLTKEPARAHVITETTCADDWYWCRRAIMLGSVVRDGEWRDDGNESYWRKRRPVVSKYSIAGIPGRELSRVPSARNAALMIEGAVEMDVTV